MGDEEGTGTEAGIEPVKVEATIDTTQDTGAPDTLERVKAALLDTSVEFESDPEATQRELVEQVLAAESFEEAMGETVVTHARDVLDRPFVYLGVRWHGSSFEGGPKVFATCDVVDPTTGERALITCSAVRVMAKLFRASMDDRWGWLGVLRSADRPTQAGYYPLWLQVEVTPDAGDETEPAPSDTEPAQV